MAHRSLWSLVFLAVVVAVTRGWPVVRRTLATPRKRWLLLAAAALVSINWTGYIWAVNADHVVEASLGYFINPLVSVLIGVVVLSERLRAAQWVAVGLGTAAVAVLTVAYGGRRGWRCFWRRRSPSTAWPRSSPTYQPYRA